MVLIVLDRSFTGLLISIYLLLNKHTPTSSIDDRQLVVAHHSSFL